MCFSLLLKIITHLVYGFTLQFWKSEVRCESFGTKTKASVASSFWSVLREALNTVLRQPSFHILSEIVYYLTWQTYLVHKWNLNKSQGINDIRIVFCDHNLFMLYILKRFWHPNSCVLCKESLTLKRGE